MLYEVITDKIRMLVNMIYEPVLIFAHPEKIVGLADGLRHGLMIRAFAVHQFALGVEPFASIAVNAFRNNFV